MSFAEYDRYDGIGLGELISAGKISAREVMDEAIARAEARNPKINAIVFEAYDRAHEAAAAGPASGPFAGVPMLLKDLRAGAAGMPTRSGSRMMPAVPSDHDSTVVARFRAAGLIPMGKTNVPEFGILPTTESVLYGPCRNPWDFARSAGGSSGGSAAAVAAGIVPLAHATDGGGSIRIPACCNGLVGLKVSRGRVTQSPDGSDGTLGLSVDNVVTRSVRDTAAILDAICAPDYGDPYFALPAEASYRAAAAQKPRRLRIAMSTTGAEGEAIHPDVEAAVRRTAGLCEELGHTVEEAMPEGISGTLTTAFLTLWAAAVAYGVESASRLTGIKPSTEVLEGITLSLYERGMTLKAIEQTWAQQTLYRYARQVARFHETYDLWLTPTLGAPAIKLGAIDVTARDLDSTFAPLVGYVPFTAMQNGTGQPAINLPLYWNGDGLPIGVQFAARTGDEKTLLQLATQLEDAAPWFDRRPEFVTQS